MHYSQRLIAASRRAARLGLYIDRTTPDAHIDPDWPGHGELMRRTFRRGMKMETLVRRTLLTMDQGKRQKGEQEFSVEMLCRDAAERIVREAA